MSNIDSHTEKIEQLISQMTLAEKIGQMYQVSDDDDSLPGGLNKAIADGLIGSIINAKDPVSINALQREAVENSRLGIPILFARDVIHGFRTIFPIPLAQAASWNPDIVRTGARVAAVEATAMGIRWTFAPSVDIARDPRWGRISETFGEDPYLTAEMGKAAVQGFQGNDLSNQDSLAACVKHFAGYGAAEGGRDYNTTMIPEGPLRDIYLPPFKAGVEVGAASFMCAFNEVNGIPCSGSTFLFQQILRDEWKYEGIVISDWESILEMIMHGYCADSKEAALSAARAGIDIEMVSKTFMTYLPALLEEQAIGIEKIDRAVRRILRLKFQLGLFDNPYAADQSEPPILTQDHLKHAKQAAIESIVLLKNQEQVLPLSKKRKVALIGPLADAPLEQLGTWIFDGKPENTVTIKTALSDILPSDQFYFEPALSHSRDMETSRFDLAMAKGKQADVIILCLGEESILSGEAHARAHIDLPGAQMQLLKELKKLKKPLILVIMAGRPLGIGDAFDLADAVLYAWHPGTMGGPAIAELLYGTANPSGKLPVTFPKSSGQIPMYYNHKKTGRPATETAFSRMYEIPIGTPQTALPNTSYYLDLGYLPLFPFGFGLSYTQFKYDALDVSLKGSSKDFKVSIGIKLTNEGALEGTEVVQVYIQDLVGSFTRPVKELKRFQRVKLQPGETRQINFTLFEKDLAYHQPNMHFGAESGTFKVFVGGNSVDVLEAEFHLPPLT